MKINGETIPSEQMINQHVYNIALYQHELSGAYLNSKFPLEHLLEKSLQLLNDLKLTHYAKQKALETYVEAYSMTGHIGTGSASIVLNSFEYLLNHTITLKESTLSTTKKLDYINNYPVQSIYEFPNQNIKFSEEDTTIHNGLSLKELVLVSGDTVLKNVGTDWTDMDTALLATRFYVLDEQDDVSSIDSYRYVGTSIYEVLTSIDRFDILQIDTGFSQDKDRVTHKTIYTPSFNTVYAIDLQKAKTDMLQ